MKDKEKFNEIEYYTYIESMLEHIEINIDDIVQLKKENNTLNKEISSLKQKNKFISIILFLIIIILIIGIFLWE